MMNELQIFQNDKLGNVRVLLIENAPWFVGKDVAEALEYKRPRDAIRNHVDNEDKKLVKSGELPLLGVTSPYGVYIINESGLYSLIFSSDLPSAKEFKRWVTSEVLPAIRKNGSYTVEPELPERKITSDDYIRAASIISTCKNERLPYVLNLLKQGGINVPYIAKNGSVDNDTDGEAARLINTAVNDYGMSLRGIGRLTGLQPTQLTRIRTGNSIPTMQRAKIICDAIREAIPDIE